MFAQIMVDEPKYGAMSREAHISVAIEPIPARKTSPLRAPRGNGTDRLAIRAGDVSTMVEGALTRSSPRRLHAASACAERTARIRGSLFAARLDT